MKKRLIMVMALLASTLCTGPIWAALTQTQVSQLYIGVFGRASEGGGNSYWQTDPSATSMAATANVMLNTEPAKTYFGTTLSDKQAFIEHIYSNTLGKTYAEDLTGINYWVGELVGGKTKGEVISSLIVAAQDPLNAGAAQDLFNNKVEVSNYCAGNISEYTDLETFTEFLSSVTDDPATVITATQSICSRANGYWYNNTCNRCVDLSGQWDKRQYVDASSCGYDPWTDIWSVSIIQNGCNIVSYDLFRNDEGDAFSGTISGNTLTYSGSYTFAGNPVYESGVLTISVDNNRIEGPVQLDVSSAGCYASSSIVLNR